MPAPVKTGLRELTEPGWNASIPEMHNPRSNGRAWLGFLLAGAVALLAIMIINRLHPFFNSRLHNTAAPREALPAARASQPQFPSADPAPAPVVEAPTPAIEAPPGPTPEEPRRPPSPPPEAPPFVRAIGVRGLIRISWGAVPGADNYEIFRHTSADSRNARPLGISHGQVQYEDRDVAPGQPYFYWVRSHNASGAGPLSAAARGMAAGEDPVARPFIPGPPPWVLASPGTFRDKIRLAWAPVDKAEGYQIWRQLTGASEPAALLIEILPDTRAYDDYMAGSGVYEYRIKSKTSAGLSDFSRPAQGWRLSLEAPASLFVSDRTFPDRIYIFWAPVQGAVGYELWRQRLAEFSPPVSESAGINERWIQRRTVADDDARQMAFLSETAIEDTSVATNVAYAYRVRARDALGGASPFTPWQQGSMRPISSALKPPTWVTATAGDFPDRIRVAWNVVPGQRYEVMRGTNDNNGTSRCICWGTGGPYFDDVNIEPRTVYYYWIRAGDGGRTLSLFSPSASGYSAPPE